MLLSTNTDEPYITTEQGFVNNLNVGCTVTLFTQVHRSDVTEAV